ncbi:MAG: GGDEF domain-containing protein [Dehalococcoidia bacterium]|nr:GGDEF domain-containing protein [Dehalococcoidia bacterium]
MKWTDVLRLDGNLPGEAERAYRLRFSRDDVRLATVSILMFALLMAGFALSDPAWISGRWVLYAIIFLRFVYLLYCIGLVVFINRKPSSDAYDWNIFIWLMCGLALLFVINLTRPSDYIGSVAIDVVLILIVYLGIPNRAVFRVTVGLLTAVAEIAIIVLLKTDIPASSVNAAICAIVMVNIVGIFASGRIYRLRRREYAATLAGEQSRMELEKLASQDGLTGILNRRVFVERAELEFQRFKRYGRAFCCLLIDVDSFKLVNDRYGHLTGDRVLRKLSEAVQECIRRSDFFGRIGGDEFGILLIEMEPEAACSTGERIREECSQASVEADSGVKVHFSVSTGFAAASDEDTDFDDIFSRADRALYAAKQNGSGGQVITSPVETTNSKR